jgi:hypothetical protein
MAEERRDIRYQQKREGGMYHTQRWDTTSQHLTVHKINCQSDTEEPDAGNPLVRFNRGFQTVTLDGY